MYDVETGGQYLESETVFNKDYCLHHCLTETVRDETFSFAVSVWLVSTVNYVHL